MKYIKKIIITLILFFSVILECTFAAVIGDYDGTAFVSKMQFEELKEDFAKQIANYESSLSLKIDGSIANYIQSIKTGKTELSSTLNTLSEDRRTFYPAITNPTTSGQDDLCITTNGFYMLSQPVPNANWSTSTDQNFTMLMGYTFAGFNNLSNPRAPYGGHYKAPFEDSNQKTGKYMFIDKEKINNKEYYYIYNNYRKDLKYKVVSIGLRVADSSDPYMIPYSGTWPEHGGPTSITWTNTYNYYATNDRSAGGGVEVPAKESLILNIENDDYDTATSAVDPVPWVNGMSGSTIYETETGTLTKENQFKWTKDITNFHIWKSGQQAIFYYNMRTNSPDATNYPNRVGNNSYNTVSDDDYVNLNFKVPTITKTKGSEIGVRDVSNKAGELTYYYSGLPLATIPKTAQSLKIYVKAKINKLTTTAGNSGVTIALMNKHFSNKTIANE